MNVLDTLAARGFVQQSTGLEPLRDALGKGPVTFYVGFDPTADSLHVGHLLQVMAMRWLQQAGHRPIAVVGGGTVMVGDPSGRTEMRTLMPESEIEVNKAALKRQLSRFLVLDGQRGFMVDNADWILPLNYITFLRDIGRHFSVNRMLSAEGYRIRFERGLSFIELNYQILQAYDFLELFRRHGCTLQVGGDDQWSNILAGADLIRRVEANDAHALTTPLITTASGEKMGKTAKGAVWLDPEKFPPFDWYQYWLNVDDRDVGKLLRLYTQLPLDEVAALEALQGADLRTAKARLAREITTLVHGEEATAQAEAAARAMVAGAASDDLPTHPVTLPARLVAVLQESGLTTSRGEARKLIQNGGVRLDNEKVDDPEKELVAIGADGVVLRVGKKKAVRVISSG